MLEAATVQKYVSSSLIIDWFYTSFQNDMRHLLLRSPLEDNQDIPSTDWEAFTAQVADMIIAEQSPARSVEPKTSFQCPRIPT